MKQLLVGSFFAAIVLSPTPAQTQNVWDPIRSLKSLDPLRIPSKAVEGAPERAEPEMAVYKPVGPGPFAAIVVHHTCAGIYAHVGTWTRQLIEAGYAVLVLDSLTQRHVRTNCNSLAVPAINGALDAYQALEYLASQPYVDKDRVGILGMSWGGMVALYAARKDVADRLPRNRKDLRFRAHAALYPHCLIPQVRVAGGTFDIAYLSVEATDRSLLVLMGEQDEETPPKFCLPRLEALKAKGVDVAWHVFPNATHAWDHAQGSGHTARTAFGGMHTYQFNPATTQESHRRVLEYFARELKS